MMQPLLLLKQTLEATYDPGPLLLNGPNVHFTSAEQLLAQLNNGRRAGSFTVGVTIGPLVALVIFKKKGGGGFRIQKMALGLKRNGKEHMVYLHEGMDSKKIASEIRSFVDVDEEAKTSLEVLKVLYSKLVPLPSGAVNRNRCFLDIKIDEFPWIPYISDTPHMSDLQLLLDMLGELSTFQASYLRQMIHLPGLRGNPERTFPVAAVGSMFPGTFHEYTASIIAQWQAEKRSSTLKLLGKYLEKLGLTWKVTAKAINDTQVELQVGRLPHSAKGVAADMVNIADVGFGVSQVLPVLVALLVAEPGQLVYIEEPEIHLHPRAQSAMAEILADAAKRGVRVVIETHSQLLLLGIQTLVAKGRLSPDLVKLHWFKRRKDGSTEITSADLDEAGTFGDWPEDFAEVALEAESRYLDAAESRQAIN